MNKTHLAYFEKEDVLHFSVSDEAEAGSIEISPNITAELNDDGELIGIEILNARAFIRDSVLESAQARLLGIAKGAKPLRIASPRLKYDKDVSDFDKLVVREKPENE